MFTHCPNCEAVFQVDAVILSKANGQVRCGRCAAVFFALEYLHDTAEEALAARTSMGGSTGLAGQPEAREAVGVEEGAAEAGEFPEAEAASEGEEAQEEKPEQAEAEGMQPAESLAAGLLAEEAKAAGQGGRMLGWAAIIALLLVLAAQVVYYERFALAGNPLWRPAMETFCNVLGCSLPLKPDLGRIVMIDRSVREHPQVDGALLVSATIVNRAPFAQPYPFVGLRLADVSGNLQAGRWFRPEEYLPGGKVPEGGMPPGEPVHLVLEILDPGTGAETLSYRFDFR